MDESSNILLLTDTTWFRADKSLASSTSSYLPSVSLGNLLGREILKSWIRLDIALNYLLGFKDVEMIEPCELPEAICDLKT